MLERLQKGERVPQVELGHVQTLRDELDDRYLEMQRAAETGPQGFETTPTSQSIAEYTLIWEKAVAASALCFAAGDNAYDAAVESTYDAAMIVQGDDRRRLLEHIEGILASRQQ